MRKIIRILLFVNLLFCWNGLLFSQQTLVNTYLYDQKGQLLAVFYVNGNTTIYGYDAAGNVNLIRNLSANELELIDFKPRAGLPGATIKIYGSGFNGVTKVTFNGSSANIKNFTNNIIIAEVPETATTGPIIVITPLGTVQSKDPFVINGIKITPNNTTIEEGESIQFSAQIRLETPDNNVIWSVNDIVGGNIFVGTINEKGFYQSPELNSSTKVLIKAASNDFPGIFDETSLRIVSQNDLRLAFSSTVSVGKGENTLLNNSFSSTVSVAKSPIISSVNPKVLARGQTSSITLTGVSLLNITGITFINPENGIDQTIGVSNIVVNKEGTLITAEVSVAGNTTPGRRFVVANTPTTGSVKFRNGGNEISVQ